MKIIGTTLVLTVAEAKELLIDWKADTLANDRDLIRQNIEGGKFQSYFWNASAWKENDIVDKVRELAGAYDLAEKHGASFVLVQMSDESLREVWSREEEKETPGKYKVTLTGYGDYDYVIEPWDNDGTSNFYRKRRSDGREEHIGYFNGVHGALWHLTNNYNR